MKQDAELHERIFAYRDKIMYCITHKKVFELENILNELTMAQDDNPDNLRIYNDLRLNIIHGQICLANFFTWKKEQKDIMIKKAKNAFSQALRDDQERKPQKKVVHIPAPPVSNRLQKAISARRAQRPVSSRPEESQFAKQEKEPLHGQAFSSQPQLAPLASYPEINNLASTAGGTSTAEPPDTVTSRKNNNFVNLNSNESVRTTGNANLANQMQNMQTNELQEMLEKEPDTYDEIAKQLKFLKNIIDANIRVHSMKACLID